MSTHAQDEAEKQELLRLSLHEGKDELDALKVELTSVLDLLDKYKSIKLTFEQKLHILPKMLPRYYTIASSSSISPTKVRIAISLSEYESPTGKPFKGLASEYFDRIFKNFKEEAKEARARIFFRESLFKLPERLETPIIMVGPGTGVVPFIAFSEEREYIKSKNPEENFGVAHLYFGCKDRNEDYIYKDEIAKFKEAGNDLQIPILLILFFLLALKCRHLISCKSS
jgi:NADPH-ferrihemoprotein reductase